MRVFFVLAVFAAFLLYSTGLWAPFHLDDQTVLTHAESFGWSTRPLGYGSFWLNEQLALLFGPMLPWKEPFYYRIVNVLIHAVAATALFWFMWLLTEQWMPAVIAGTLFLVHPIQTQGITYITQRFESQAAMFMFLAGGAYIRFRKGGRWPWVVLTLVFSAGAALTKESAVVLPLWLLFIELVFFGFTRVRKLVLYLIPFGLVLVVPAWNAFQASRTTLTSISWDQYFLTQGPVLSKYFELSTWPRKQFLYYDFQPVSALSFTVVLQWLLVIAVFVLGIYLLRRNRLIGFGLLSFFIFLLPVILLPLPDLIFEHRLYPAFAGFAIAAAGVFQAINRKSALAVFGLIVVLLGVKTFMRNERWNDHIDFLEDHLAAFPKDPALLARLASYYFISGRINKSLELNLESRKYEDRYNAYYRQTGHLLTSVNLSAIYLIKGDPEASKVEALRAIAAKPSVPQAWRALGQAQMALLEFDDAHKTYEKLVLMDPSVDSWSSLRQALYLSGDTAGAAVANQKMGAQERIEETPSRRLVIPDRYKTYIFFGFTLALLVWIVFSIYTIVDAIRTVFRQRTSS